MDIGKRSLLFISSFLLSYGVIDQIDDLFENYTIEIREKTKAHPIIVTSEATSLYPPKRDPPPVIAEDNNLDFSTPLFDEHGYLLEAVGLAHFEAAEKNEESSASSDLQLPLSFEHGVVAVLPFFEEIHFVFDEMGIDQKIEEASTETVSAPPVEKEDEVILLDDTPNILMESVEEIVAREKVSATMPNSIPANPSQKISVANETSPLPTDLDVKSKNISEHKDNYYLPTAKRMDLRHVQGSHGGIGFGTDYSTVAVLFAPDYRLGHTLPMIDARIHRFDNNTYAANLGVAGRYLPEDNTFCEMLGFNFFYDYRQGLRTDHNYNQLGVGIEVLGKRWDFRANCYFPVGRSQHRVKCVFDDFEGGFFMIHRKCEGVSYGYNAEIGYQLTKEQPFLLYVAAGPYYLARKCHDHTLGGKARLRPQYKDYLALDLSVSYDPVFHTVYQAEVIVSIPLYQICSKKSRHGPCGMSDRKVYQPIIRFEVSPLGKKSCWHTNF